MPDGHGDSIQRGLVGQQEAQRCPRTPKWWALAPECHLRRGHTIVVNRREHTMKTHRSVDAPCPTCCVLSDLDRWVDIEPARRRTQPPKLTRPSRAGAPRSWPCPPAGAHRRTLENIIENVNEAWKGTTSPPTSGAWESGTSQFCARTHSHSHAAHTCSHCDSHNLAISHARHESHNTRLTCAAAARAIHARARAAYNEPMNETLCTPSRTQLAARACWSLRSALAWRTHSRWHLQTQSGITLPDTSAEASVTT